MMYRLLVPHINVQIANSNSVSRRLRRGASTAPVAREAFLFIDGKNNHTMTPQTINATAALRYITVKLKPIASA
ncbi:hypothetical protein D3C73_1570520 [compost metagenome]